MPFSLGMRGTWTKKYWTFVCTLLETLSPMEPTGGGCHLGRHKLTWDLMRERWVCMQPQPGAAITHGLASMDSHNNGTGPREVWEADHCNAPPPSHPPDRLHSVKVHWLSPHSPHRYFVILLDSVLLLLILLFILQGIHILYGMCYVTYSYVSW